MGLCRASPEPAKNPGGESPQESEEERRARRAKAWTRVVRPGDDVDLEAEDIAYWLRLTPEERVIETWRLSEEIWSLASGEASDE